MLAGWTGVAARAMGNMMAITLANTMPGHLAAPGRLSETHEFIRVQTIEIMLICLCELGFVAFGARATYTKGDDVDLGNGKYGRFTGNVVTLNPEDHCCLLGRYYAWEGGWYGLLDPPDWPTWVRKAKNKGTLTCQHLKYTSFG